MGLAALLAAVLAAAPPDDADWTRTVAPFLAATCLDCHDAATAEGELVLERFRTADDALAEPDVWRAVHARLASGEMPPPAVGERPDAEEVSDVLAWIEARFDVAPAIGRGPGSTTMRRLNRNEYRWAVLDLCGVDYPANEVLPADGVAHGFDTVGEALSLPPMMLEKLVEAAEVVAAEAVPRLGEGGHPALRVGARELALDEGLRFVESHDAVSMSRNGAASVTVRVSRSGEYFLRVRAAGQQAGPDPARMDVSVDGQVVERVDVTATPEEPATYAVRARVEAGDRRFAVAFVNDWYEPDHPDPDERDRNLWVGWLEIVGPLDQPRDTPFLARWAPPGADARAVVARFARAAWRRPPEPAQVDALLALSDPAAGRDERVRAALVAVLASPRFLFRVEPEPDIVDARPLDDWELAARLAAFLWSSVPDERLLAQAEAGALRAELHGEVDRMLEDGRASRLSETFCASWLQLGRLDAHDPDPARFPAFDAELERAMRRESALFFDAVLREGRRAHELLSADFTFVNERLARHYGIPGVEGPAMRRVPVPDWLVGTRGGVLGQAAVMTATSNPTRTSPVLRGKWVLEALLDQPPPPPPPGVGVLDESAAARTAASLRERLEQHRADPACASCHAPMDALGFALENYDATGAWRTSDGGFPVDATAALPDGRPVAGPAGLRAVLLTDRAFERGLVRRLAAFALGRGLGPDDEAAVETALTALPPEPTLRELIHAVCGLEAFGTRRRGARAP